MRWGGGGDLALLVAPTPFGELGSGVSGGVISAERFRSASGGRSNPMLERFLSLWVI